VRTVTEAILALAPKPGGFTAKELARKVNESTGTTSTYNSRQAAYHLAKLRGKCLIERVAHTRNYTINAAGIRSLAGLLILREKVIRPVLAGICKPRLGRPPKTVHPIDIHYQNLQREMHLTLRHLALPA
jgi:hypothetical protein